MKNFFKKVKQIAKVKNIDLKDLTKLTDNAVYFLEETDDATHGLLPLKDAIIIAKVLDVSLDYLVSDSDD